jgi:hypothetical protein
MGTLSGFATASTLTLLPNPSRKSPKFFGAPGLRFFPSTEGYQRLGKMFATEGTQMA